MFRLSSDDNLFYKFMLQYKGIELSGLLDIILHKNFKAVCEYVTKEIEKFIELSKGHDEDLGSEGKKRPLISKTYHFESNCFQKRLKFDHTLINKEIETYAYIKRGSIRCTIG